MTKFLKNKSSFVLLKLWSWRFKLLVLWAMGPQKIEIFFRIWVKVLFVHEIINSNNNDDVYNHHILIPIAGIKFHLYSMAESGRLIYCLKNILINGCTNTLYVGLFLTIRRLISPEIKISTLSVLLKSSVRLGWLRSTCFVRRSHNWQ